MTEIIEKEFVLDEHIQNCSRCACGENVNTIYVRKFIKMLKEELIECEEDNDWRALLFSISKLAGKNLIK